MKNSSYIMFTMMLMFSYMMMISSNNWLSMWMSMEINLISFMPIMYNNKNIYASESMMIYFIVQTMSSILFLFSLIYSNMILYKNNYIFHIFMMISMMIKLGMPPFHLWSILMMKKMKWITLYFLLTIQKIMPIIILSMIMKNFMMIFIMLSTMISSISGINQTNLLKIILYSSINHSSWMMMSLFYENNMWMMYMLIYMLILFMFVNIMKKNNIMFINQMNMNMNLENKIMIMILFLSLSGLPPFIGFLPKWMIIQTMINLKSYLFMLIMLMSSLIIMYFYLQIIMNMLMINYNLMKWNNKKKKSLSLFNMNMILNLMMPIILLMNFM
uniref:NADH-ubiquinone oxidoreductase chain 2 n=1 Tax=Stenopirates sp. NKU01 TaxID=1124183 RepID=A0A1D6UZD3_9HEMI|nr:NADH dehydrogenase subunit 2 [Stenopirates sp. NKU01]